MKTVILLLKETPEAISYCINYIGSRFCEMVGVGLTISTTLSEEEKQALINGLEKYDTIPVFIEATKEEIDSTGEVLTLKIKK